MSSSERISGLLGPPRLSNLEQEILFFNTTGFNPSYLRNPSFIATVFRQDNIPFLQDKSISESNADALARFLMINGLMPLQIKEMHQVQIMQEVSRLGITVTQAVLIRYINDHHSDPAKQIEAVCKAFESPGYFLGENTDRILDFDNLLSSYTHKDWTDMSTHVLSYGKDAPEKPHSKGLSEKTLTVIADASATHALEAYFEIPLPYERYDTSPEDYLREITSLKLLMVRNARKGLIDTTRRTADELREIIQGYKSATNANTVSAVINRMHEASVSAEFASYAMTEIANYDQTPSSPMPWFNLFRSCKTSDTLIH